MTDNKCRFGIFNNTTIPSFSPSIITISENRCALLSANRSGIIRLNSIPYYIIDNTYSAIFQNTNNGNISDNINFNNTQGMNIVDDGTLN